jgi:hypothetical protein
MDDLKFSPGRITTDRYRRLYPENCLKTWNPTKCITDTGKHETFSKVTPTLIIQTPLTYQEFSERR